MTPMSDFLSDADVFGAPVTKGMVINKLVADALFDGFVQDVINHIERLVKAPSFSMFSLYSSSVVAPIT